MECWRRIRTAPYSCRVAAATPCGIPSRPGMCEAGVNIKVIQDALGHSDISTTLNIYADVTKELRKSEFENLDRQFAQWKDPEE